MIGTLLHRVLNVCILGLALGGCAERNLVDLEEYAAEVRRRPGGVIDPMPEFRPVYNYLYESGDEKDGRPPLRDPFVSILKEEATETVVQTECTCPAPEGAEAKCVSKCLYEAEVTQRPKEELEAFELDSLRMMGIMQDAETLWAIVVDPAGTVHRVEVGNYLGRNTGKVTAIEESVIRIREIVADAEGVLDERAAQLALPEEP